MPPLHLPFITLMAATLMLNACGRQEPAADPIRAVRTLTVAPDSASAVHEYPGEIRARTESRLSFQVGGKIVRRAVDVGSVVKAGQVLAQLDPQDLRLGQQAAQAALLAAQATLDQATLDLKRYRELRDQGFLSSAELERRETSLIAARSQFDQARAQSNLQGNQAGYANLVADASGVVTGVDGEPGMVVSPGMAVLRLAHDGPRDLVFSVPEDRVTALHALAARPGVFQVRLWDAGTETLPAKIREISAAADPVTRTFQVKAGLDVEASSKVQLGQTATLLVKTPAVAGVVKLPLSALKEENGDTVVWVLDPSDMTVQLRPVMLAGVNGNKAVIASGLQPGQQVVTAGVHVLSPGQKVKHYVDPSAVAAKP